MGTIVILLTCFLLISCVFLLGGELNVQLQLSSPRDPGEGNDPVQSPEEDGRYEPGDPAEERNQSRPKKTRRPTHG
jgi:uncharacterized BrkB/YihY/UPF0761 family membrane protein